MLLYLTRPRAGAVAGSHADRGLQVRAGLGFRFREVGQPVEHGTFEAGASVGLERVEPSGGVVGKQRGLLDNSAKIGQEFGPKLLLAVLLDCERQCLGDLIRSKGLPIRPVGYAPPRGSHRQAAMWAVAHR